jgi:hypothetical protein
VSLGRLDPIPVLVEAGVNAGRADDNVRRVFQGGVFHTLEDVFEDTGEFTPSAGEESCGVGVAVERGAVGKLEIFGDISRASPADELALDGIALRMGTDAAPGGCRSRSGGSEGSEEAV